MTHFSHKAILKMKRLSRNAHKHHASVYGVTVMGSVHCAWAEGFGRKSALLNSAVLCAFCVACMQIIHPRCQGNLALLCSLGFPTVFRLSSLNYHFLLLTARKGPLRPSQRHQKHNILFGFLPPFVSSAGYSLRLNLTPIVKARFFVNYCSSQILSLFFCVIKKLLQ